MDRLALFHELADLAPAEREKVSAERQVSPELRAEVESLLSFDSASSVARHWGLGAVGRIDVDRMARALAL